MIQLHIACQVVHQLSAEHIAVVIGWVSFKDKCNFLFKTDDILHVSMGKESGGIFQHQ